MIRRGIGGLLLALLTSAVPVLGSDTQPGWPQMGFSPKGSRFNPHETVLGPSSVAGLSLTWTAAAGDVIRSAPAIVDGVVYAGSWDGKLYAWDEASGASKWVADAPGIRNSSPAVSNGLVFMASYYGDLYAFQKANGKPAWSVKVSRFPVSSPAVAHGTVYVTSGSLYAYDAKTGALKWSARVRRTTTPAVANGLVYATSHQGLRAFNAQTGALVWKRSAPVVSSPAFANGMVYAVYANSGTDYGVEAFDGATGKPLWHSPFGGFSQSDLAVGDGGVYVGSFDGNVYAFNQHTGALKWTFKAGTEVDDAPAVANGIVYAASTEDGVLYALDAASGTSLWSASTAATFMFSSPSVVDGKVFVGSDDHNLYSFSLDGRGRGHH